MGWLTEPLGLVLVGLITVVGSWLTTGPSTRSDSHVTGQTVAAQIETSRIQAEQKAYERPGATLGRTIDRLNSEVTELEADIVRLTKRLDELERLLSPVSRLTSSGSNASASGRSIRAFSRW